MRFGKLDKEDYQYCFELASVGQLTDAGKRFFGKKSDG